ncbi:MAG: hypothetical protein QNJ46_26395 [Leptolyngbyaceae cyanobacterium MO_188.B28]|nr:hypothetical protein [Leptolyngbyaceae cyanobacterium MO_188.B28]
MAFQESFNRPLTIKNGIATYNVSQDIGASKLIPDSWNEIVIKNGVTLKGNFVVRPGRTKPLLIRGESKTGSVIEGLGNHQRYEIDGSRAFNHSAVYYGGFKAVIAVVNLTSKNPDFFHLLSCGKIIVNNVRLINTSKESEKNGFDDKKNGFDDNDGSIVRNIFVSPTEDANNICMVYTYY